MRGDDLLCSVGVVKLSHIQARQQYKSLSKCSGIRVAHSLLQLITEDQDCMLMSGRPSVSVVLTNGCSVGSALYRRLNDLGGGGGGGSRVRSSPVLDCWDGLVDVSATYRGR